MSKLFVSIAMMAVLAMTCSAATSPVEVLYVAQPQGSSISLLTYNVNPETAVAQQVGNTISVGSTSIDPLTIGSKHFVYVWNSTDVWMYVTNAKGVPAANPSQHLSFNFVHPVTTFLADPNGKFAYAGLTWDDYQYNSYAAVMLFTIDQVTGKLTNTEQVVANYGPNQYIGIRNFSFGSTGKRLYAYYFDDGPHTCIIGYDYYLVNQTTGRLGSLKSLFYAQADCSGHGAVTLSDLLSASASACCGAGSGSLTIASIAGKPKISCEYTPAFCADDPGQLAFDPANKNIFFSDMDLNQVFIGHIDFATSQLIQAPTSIPGLPAIYFSPDSELVYAVNSNSNDIGIYTFQSSTGDLISTTTLPDQGNVGIATTTLP
jgi:6-phosphogluconolactonase (cycloisomerase 2 family)